MSSRIRFSTLVFVFLLFMAAAGSLCAQDTEHFPTPHSFQPTWNHQLSMIGMQLLIATWIFVLGACFGSFLNVVIYRLPAGMSLGKPKSRCPKCETPLSARDNVPVLGWIMLRGKCRYCSLPIPARYPIVEAVCGGIFLALLFGELLTGAANLPLRHPDHFHVNPGFWLVWFMKWDLAGVYLYHCCMLTVVLAISMIGYDGHPPQIRLAVFGLLAGAGIAVFFDDLRPVPAIPYPEVMQSMKWGFRWDDPLMGSGNRYWTGVSLRGLCDGLAGVVGGVLTGALVKWQMKAEDDQSGAQAPVAAISTSLIVTGGFLGWQACVTLGLFVLPVLAVCRIVDRSSPLRRCQHWAAPAYFVSLFAFLLSWKHLDDSVWMIGYSGWSFSPLRWWWDWLATFLLLFAFATVVRFSDRQGETSQPRD